LTGSASPNLRQRRTLRPIGLPENGPSCPGSSRRLRSSTCLADPRDR
jgi:hypothetical protein